MSINLYLRGNKGLRIFFDSEKTKHRITRFHDGGLYLKKAEGDFDFFHPQYITIEVKPGPFSRKITTARLPISDIIHNESNRAVLYFNKVTKEKIIQFLVKNVTQQTLEESLIDELDGPSIGVHGKKPTSSPVLEEPPAESFSGRTLKELLIWINNQLPVENSAIFSKSGNLVAQGPGIIPEDWKEKASLIGNQPHFSLKDQTYFYPIIGEQRHVLIFKYSKSSLPLWFHQTLHHVGPLLRQSENNIIQFPKEIESLRVKDVLAETYFNKMAWTLIDQSQKEEYQWNIIAPSLKIGHIFGKKETLPDSDHFWKEKDLFIIDDIHLLSPSEQERFYRIISNYTKNYSTLFLFSKHIYELREQGTLHEDLFDLLKMSKGFFQNQKIDKLKKIG
jgi:hypothetical protein